MTTTVQNNDTSDLLILSDEPTITLDESPIIEENTSTMDDLITFGDEEAVTETKTEEPVMEIKEETGLDMWLDLTWATETKTEEPVMEIKEETGLDMWLDLTWATETKTEEPVMEVKEETGLDMWLLSTENNDIINEEEKNTIFSLEEATNSYVEQLEARKEQISNDISDDEKIIWIKEDKIKNLRSEISDYKKLIKDLNDEDNEIDEKIWLVSWKNKVNELKAKTTTRVHNAKRKKAA